MKLIYRTQQGFTLIELILFIVVSSILASTILLSMRITLLNIPSMHNAFIANQLANQCMEGFIGKRRMFAYTDASFACSASPPLPSVCSSPTGFTTSATITCTPTLTGDAVTSKTVTVTVTGKGDATLTTLLANY